MAKTTDYELIERVLAATEGGKIDWKQTAHKAQFTASFGGKWTLLTEEYIGQDDVYRYDLEMKDSEGKLLLRLTSVEDSRIVQLHELARRYALKVDDAIADLLSELDKPQS